MTVWNAALLTYTLCMSGNEVNTCSEVAFFHPGFENKPPLSCPLNQGLVVSIPVSLITSFVLEISLLISKFRILVGMLIKTGPIV